jgi:hypothetical protein
LTDCFFVDEGLCRDVIARFAVGKLEEPGIENLDVEIISTIERKRTTEALV